MSRGGRNKRQGNGWELTSLKMFADTFGLEAFSRKNFASFQIASSRAMSRTRDAQKKDWSWSDLAPEWCKSLAVQCKKSMLPRRKKYSTIKIDAAPLFELKEFCSEEETPILLTKVTKDAGKKEVEVGKFVTMEYVAFLALLKKMNEG